MEFENILNRVGDYGRFQQLTIWGYLFPVCVLDPMLFSLNLFFVSEPDHWCRVDQLSNLSNSRQVQLISPLISEGVYNKCAMYDVDYDQVAKMGILGNGSSLPVKPCDNGWTYDTTNYAENAVTYYDLVCDKRAYQGHFLSIITIGTIIGTPILGWLGDTIGRRKLPIIVMVLHIFSSMSPIFSKHMVSFFLLRIINSMGTPTNYEAPYLVTMEIVALNKRALVSMLTSIGWALGLCILPGVVYLSRTWVSLTSISAVCGLFALILSCSRLNSESPRWLLSAGRYDEAAALLQEMARVNGKPVPVREELIEALKSVAKPLTADEAEYESRNLFTSPRLRMTFILLTTSWISMSVAYSGLTLHSINLPGNEFVNFFYMSLVEIPGYFICWQLIETPLGRRWTNALSLALAGICLCLPVLFPPSWASGTVVMNVIAKLSVTISGQVSYQQAAELYPTPVRQQGLSLGSTVSAIAAVLVPQVALLDSYAPWLPMFIIGVISLIGALAASCVAETHNMPLPQTMAEGECFGKGIPFWTLAKKEPEHITQVDSFSEHVKLNSK
ncbi:Organic cation transporter 1 [Halotydeus destructor]|nr:Organic cation transporter 1 [Halotydeus destructor]